MTDTHTTVLATEASQPRPEPPTAVEPPGPEDSRQLMVNPHLRVVRCGDHEVLVKHGARSRFSEILRDEARTKLLGPVIDRLRRPATLAELVAEGVVAQEQADTAAGLMSHLHERGVLIEAGADPTLAYLDTVLERDSPAVAALADKRIRLLGVGGLAARVARQLAALRPAEIVLVGPADRAEMLAGELREAGAPRVEAQDRDPFASETVHELLASGDLAIVALDRPSPSALHAVNEAAIVHRAPWLGAWFDGSDGMVGPLVVPGESPCYLELEMQTEAAVGIRDDYLLYQEELRARPQTEGHVLPAYLDVAGGWSAVAAMRYLLAERCFLVGRQLRIDFERLAVDSHEVLRLPRCPACVSLRPAYQHTFL